MLKNYLKIAWKVLGRNKFFTFVSLFGISITLAILLVVTTFVDHMLGAKYPETNRDRSIFIRKVSISNPEKTSLSSSGSSFYLLDRYVKKMETPEHVAIVSHGLNTNTFVEGRKLTLNLRYTCEDFWKVHEFNFLSGQPYTAQHIRDNQFVAVISQATSDLYFGSGEEAVGRWINSDNVRYQVIGVVENVPVYRLVTDADIYVPYNTFKGDLHHYSFIGEFMGILMAEGKADIPAMKAEFNKIIDNIEIPPSEELSVLEARAETIVETISRNLSRNDEPKPGLLYGLLIGGMLLFMLLPALNLVNLNSSRIMERASEIGVRKAFGATSSVLTVQFIIENIVLSLLGGLIGLGLAWVILQVIESSGWIPYAQLSINFTVLLIGLALAFTFGILSGVLPARRMSKLPIVNAIKGDV